MCNSCKSLPTRLDNITSLKIWMGKLAEWNKNKDLLLKNCDEDLKKRFFDTEKEKNGKKSTRLQRFMDCWSYLGFQVYCDKSNWKIIKKVTANYCKNPLCYECNRKRIYKKRMTLLSAIQSKGIDKLHCYFLVLTVKHDELDSIEEVFKKLTNSKTKLRDMMNNAKSWKWRHTVFSCVEWAYWAIEVTNENGNGRHIHLNYILFTNKEIDLTVVYWKNNKPITSKWKILTISREIRDEWLSITWDSTITSMQKVDISTTEKLEKSLWELIKYCLKDDKLTSNEKLEFGIATRWKRMNWGRGSLYNIKEVEDDDIDNIAIDDLLEDDLLENGLNDDNKDKKEKEEVKRIDWTSKDLVKIWDWNYTARFNWYNNYFERTGITLTDEWKELWFNKEYLEEVIPIRYVLSKDWCEDQYW